MPGWRTDTATSSRTTLPALSLATTSMVAGGEGSSIVNVFPVSLAAVPFTVTALAPDEVPLTVNAPRRDGAVIVSGSSRTGAVESTENVRRVPPAFPNGPLRATLTWRTCLPSASFSGRITSPLPLRTALTARPSTVTVTRLASTPAPGVTWNCRSAACSPLSTACSAGPAIDAPAGLGRRTCMPTIRAATRTRRVRRTVTRRLRTVGMLGLSAPAFRDQRAVSATVTSTKMSALAPALSALAAAVVLAGCAASPPAAGAHHPVSRPAQSSPSPAAPTPSAPVTPSPADVGANELGRVPVIMYHQLKDHPKGVYDITPARFPAGRERLAGEGYVPITAADYAAGQIDIPAGKHPVVLTFDDSTRSQLTLTAAGEPKPGTAAAILLEVAARHPGFTPTATFFVNKAPFAEPGGRRHLGWLHDHGFEVGNHTLDHLPMRGLRAEQVRRQIAADTAMIT